MKLDIATKQDIEELKEQINKLTATISLMSSCLSKQKACTTVDVNDIAQMKGISRTTLVERMPYLMPQNGVSEYAGKKRWNLSTYQEWDARPVSEREMAWKAQLKNQARAYKAKKGSQAV